jgi:hypothetical protein
MSSDADPAERHAGLAALGLLESLLIHLFEKGALTFEELDRIFSAVIEAHEEALREGGGLDHRAVADLLRKVQTGKNGVRLPMPRR